MRDIRIVGSILRDFLSGNVNNESITKCVFVYKRAVIVEERISDRWKDTAIHVTEVRVS